jgi:epoxyqueuosine reductase
LEPAKVRHNLASLASELGFDVCRFTEAELPELAGRRFDQAVRDRHHGTMEWLAETRARRASPRAMWPQARSAILMGMNYGPAFDPLQSLNRRERATISVYARNRDYHGLMKGRLKRIAQRLVRLTGEEVKVFVDTAPLMEKPLAEQAGLGWQGKHTNLVSREYGSWLFLGAILTTAYFDPDPPQEDLCGSCRACIDICPTDAFPAPYRLDARRCISYLTIEHKGPVPRQFRKAMGNRIFGCDDCLAVCPWNKFAQTAREARLQARDDLNAPSLDHLASLDDAEFRKFFSGSPIKRIGRNRFIRNVLIAIGNASDPALADSVMPHLEDPDPQIRGAAVWALGNLLGGEALELRFAKRGGRESDPDVQEEWRLAFDGNPSQP